MTSLEQVALNEIDRLSKESFSLHVDLLTENDERKRRGALDKIGSNMLSIDRVLKAISENNRAR